MVSADDRMLLAEIIVANLQEEFVLKHLSGNLLDSIHVEENGDSIQVIIDAPAYDMLEYLKNKVIIHTGKGSYASSIDEKGGEIFGRRTGNHVGYVDKIIMKSLQTWKELIQKGITLKQWGQTEYGTGSEIE